MQHRRIVSAGCGLLLSPSPVPGFFAAALFLPQGIHSDHGEWFVPVWIASNFVLFGCFTYWVLTSRAKRREIGADKPMKGTFYTESEVEEFRRRGLMSSTGPVVTTD
jgi:hypothetical protein